MEKNYGTRDGKEFRYYTKKVLLEPYGWEVYIVFSTDIRGTRATKKFIKLLEGPDRNSDRKSYAFCTTVEGKCLSVLFLPMQDDGRVCSAGTMAHEALHAVYSCMETTGVGWNEEAMCYSLQTLVSQIDNFSRKIWVTETKVEKNS